MKVPVGGGGQGTCAAAGLGTGARHGPSTTACRGCISLSLQVFSEPGSSSARCAPTSELYNVCLVQTNLLEAIADEDYFLHCVKRCEENYDHYLACMEKGTLGQPTVTAPCAAEGL